jgi:hypothetical protein
VLVNQAVELTTRSHGLLDRKARVNGGETKKSTKGTWGMRKQQTWRVRPFGTSGELMGKKTSTVGPNNAARPQKPASGSPQLFCRFLDASAGTTWASATAETKSNHGQLEQGGSARCRRQGVEALVPGRSRFSGSCCDPRGHNGQVVGGRGRKRK